MKQLFLCLFVILLVSCSAQQDTSYRTEYQNPAATQPTKNVPDGWYILKSSEGVEIIKERDRFSYLFLIDPSTAQITVRATDGSGTFMDEILHDNEPGADCAFSGPYFDQEQWFSDAIQTLPIIEDGVVTPGTETDRQRIRTLYIQGSRIWVSDTPDNASIQNADYALSGYHPAEYDGVSLNEEYELFYEVMAIKDSQLLVATTVHKTIEDITSLFASLGVDPNTIIVLNDHPQAGCFAVQYYQWNITTGSAIFVSTP